MRRWAIKIVVVTAFLTAATGSSASTDESPPGSRSFACPISGTKFEQRVDHPHCPLVQFPDASHMGDEFIDTQIPECPDNKLLILPDFSVEPPAGQTLVYHEYGPSELQQLPGLLTSAEWAALLRASRHQRAYWLATKLGRPANDRIQLLIRSQWATAASPTLHRSALQQLVREIPGLIVEAKLKPEEAVVAQFLRVNALRELGQFEEASATLDALEREGMRALGPNDPDALFSPGDYGEKMRAVIAAGDDDRFAVDLLPDNFARRICGSAEPNEYRGKHAAKACAARKKRQEDREAMFARANALEADLPALERRCATLPPDNSDEALAFACRGLAHKRDWAEGQKIADGDPVALAEMCEGVEAGQRSTIEESACSTYDTYRNGVATALVTALDLASYNALCGAGPKLGFGFACDQAFGYREKIAARQLLRDQAALSAKCNKGGENQEYALQIACEALTAKTPPYWLSEEPPVVDENPISRAALPFVESALKTAINRR